MDCFKYAQVTQVPRPRKHPEPLPNAISTLEASLIFFQMSRHGGVRLSFLKNRCRVVAKWLTDVLKPVVDKFSTHTVKDTFEFCENIQNYPAENDTNNASVFF